MCLRVHEATGLEACTSPRGEELGTLAAPTVIDPMGEVEACDIEAEFPAYEVIAQVVGLRAELRMPRGSDSREFGLTAVQLRERLMTRRAFAIRELAQALGAEFPAWKVRPVETWRGPRLEARRRGGWPAGTCALITDDPTEMRRELKEAG